MGERYLHPQYLLGYQLTKTSLRIRRTDCGSLGSLFQCPLIYSLSQANAAQIFLNPRPKASDDAVKEKDEKAIESSAGALGWATLQQQAIVCAIHRLFRVNDAEGKTLIDVSWDHSIMLLG